jgi:hypothetical protein
VISTSAGYFAKPVPSVLLSSMLSCTMPAFFAHVFIRSLCPMRIANTWWSCVHVSQARCSCVDMDSDDATSNSYQTGCSGCPAMPPCALMYLNSAV